MAEDKTDSQKIYLVIADETEGFQKALHYVSLLSKKNKAQIAILYVMDKEDFQYWGDIEERIHEEHLEHGESILSQARERIMALEPEIEPVTYLKEGGRLETIIELIENEKNIKRLILGADPQIGAPGPLVSYFTGKGLPRLRVPLTIIPGTMEEDTIDQLY